MILVTSGCQSAAIAAALAGMLPTRSVRAAVPGVRPGELEAQLPGAEAWITSLSPAEQEALLVDGRPPRVINVPNLYFHGFHPDIAHLRTPDGRPLGSAAGEYSSAIVAAGWKVGLDVEQVLACFDADVFRRLGFFDAWSVGVQILRDRFAASDLGFDSWFLPLVRRGVFMLTDNHPTVAALVQLARLVADQLGAEADLVTFPWETVVPDGLLATSTVWPVYPPLAGRRGVPGGYVWRAAGGGLLGLERFVAATLDGYRDVDPEHVADPRLDDPRLLDVVMTAGLGLRAAS